VIATTAAGAKVQVSGYFVGAAEIDLRISDYRFAVRMR
jgi:hypothetical protein